MPTGSAALIAPPFRRSWAKIQTVIADKRDA
jgi:hypothetical protein